MRAMGENHGTWVHGVERRHYPALENDVKTEVAIIGGGITGVLSAYLLAKAGKSVVLLEKGRLGEWTTHWTSAFLTQSVDTDYSDLVWMLGKEGARQVAESHGKAIELVERITEEEKMDCEFRRVPNRIVARTQKEAEGLKKETEAMRSLGLRARYQEKNNLAFPISGCTELESQATFHPMKFLALTAGKAQYYGAQIFEDTTVTRLTKNENGWELSAGGKKVTAAEVIAATYDPFGQPWHLYFKKGLYYSYIIEFAAPAGALPQGIYEDLAEPYHYFRVDEADGQCRILFGGEDHRKEIKLSPEKNYKALRKHAEGILKGIPLAEKRRWRGPILEPVDGLAHIGFDRRSGLYRAFAFSGNGLTYAAIAAGMFEELICKKKGPMGAYQDLYAVNRLPTPKSLWVKGRDYTKILFGGAVKNSFV